MDHDARKLRGARHRGQAGAQARPATTQRARQEALPQAEGSPDGFGTNEAAWSGACGTNGVEVTTEQLSTNAGGQLASNRVNTVSFNVLVP